MEIQTRMITRNNVVQQHMGQFNLHVLPYGFRKKKNFTIHVAKIKALISFAVCAFCFTYADCWFSYEAACLIIEPENLKPLWTSSGPVVEIRNFHH